MSFQSIWEELRRKGVQTARYPYEKIISFVMRYHPKEKNREDIHILEIGCGAGNNLWALALEGFKVYGIDGSQTAIEMAKDIFKKFQIEGNLRVGDFTEKLPYEDEKFDLVFDRGSITCVEYEDAKRTIQEVYRVLKKGGYFFFNPYSIFHTSYITAKNRANNRYVLTENGSIAGTGYVCFYGMIEAMKIIDQFEVLEFKELILKDEINGHIHGEFEIICRKPATYSP